MANLLTRLFGGLAKKYAGRYEQVMQVPPPMTTEAYIKMFGEVGWLYACVDKRASAVASANLHLYKLDKRSDQVELYDHPLLSLLAKPNPHTTGYKLDYLTQVYLDLTGEAFWIIERDARGRPIELWSANPAYMWVFPDRENFIKGWAYRCGADNIPIAPEDVIHFYYPDPGNPYRGIGPAQAAGVDLQSSKFAKNWNRNFFYNSARPDAIIEFEKTLDEDEYESIVKHWKESHGGVKNAHSVGMLEVGKYRQISTSPKEMDFGTMQTQTRDAILSIFGVPKSILGITEDVNRANAETAEYTFAKRTVLPLLTMRMDDLNSQLVPLFGEDRLLLEYDDPTPENTEVKLREWELSFNRWATVNEIREEQGREPLENGDVIYQSATLMPMGESIYGITGYARSEDKGIAMIPVSKAKAMRRTKVKNWLDNLDRPAHWERFVAKSVENEAVLYRAWRRIWTYQENAVKDAVATLGKRLTANDSLLTKMRALEACKAGKDEIDEILSVFDEHGKDSQAYKQLRPQIEALMLESGQEFFNDTGIGIQFDIRNPKVSEWIDQYCVEQIKGINRTTKDALRETIGEDVDAGMSNAAIRDEIADYFTGASEGRLNTIVRTEVIGATNAGTLAGYTQSGVVQTKEWLAAIDERTRIDHALADGQIVSLDEDFVLANGNSGECPGNMGSAEDDCNCRCTVLPGL